MEPLMIADVKLTALAVDYDGTIAQDDIVSANTREAIAEARASGVAVLLVTGRLLEELRRVAGDLRFVDAVVAENGAVVHVSGSNHTTRLAAAVPPSFVEELRRRSIPHQVGHCLVDADARDANTLLGIIRELELPLVLLFNGGRVMVVAQGVSKATGLRVLLETLRLSAHNLVAIGDRENDHELLRLGEVGAAVEWGSAALRAAADVIVPGSGPSAVGDYIRGLAASRCLPKAARVRRRLRLGYQGDGREFSLAVRGRHVLVAGDAKSGKSWVAGLLCEQLILQGYSVCVLDPEGDYRSLEALPRVDVVGFNAPLPTPQELVRALRYPDRSLIVDLSACPHAEKIAYLHAALPVLNAVRRLTGLPHRIIVDEAHYFLDNEAAAPLLDLDAGGYTFVTYRASLLPRALLACTDVVIVTRETSPDELAALRRLCGGCASSAPPEWGMLSRLSAGQAVALPMTEESGGTLMPFTLGERLTPHVRHRDKYLDVPVPERLGFTFAADASGAPRVARTLRRFVSIIEQGVDCDGYLRRGDFSRWVGEVFGDYALASELRDVETGYRRNPSAAAAHDVPHTVRSRYEFGSGGDASAAPTPARRPPSLEYV